jgi:hypothetical protein
LWSDYQSYLSALEDLVRKIGKPAKLTEMRTAPPQYSAWLSPVTGEADRISRLVVLLSRTDRQAEQTSGRVFDDRPDDPLLALQTCAGTPRWTTRSTTCVCPAARATSTGGTARSTGARSVGGRWSSPGTTFAAPRRRDDLGWAAVAAVLAAGLRYEGFQTCGCGREPKFRPRTNADARTRLRLAERMGVPLSEALAARDPDDLT